jgi:hypothetical protein
MLASINLCQQKNLLAPKLNNITEIRKSGSFWKGAACHKVCVIGKIDSSLSPTLIEGVRDQMSQDRADQTVRIKWDILFWLSCFAQIYAYKEVILGLND